MHITFHTNEQKVCVHDIVPYFIHESTSIWTMRDVMEYLWGNEAWHVSWTTDVSVEAMLDTEVQHMHELGDIHIQS